MRLDRRRSAVCHEKFAAHTAGYRDAVGEGRGEQRPLTPNLSPRGRGERTLLPLGEGGRRPDEGGVRSLRQRARQAPRVIGALRGIAVEGRKPGRKIDRIAAESAFGQYNGDFAGRPRFAL